ncbi:MAG: hypothetical protein IPL78_36220 [Chloroflexi bacterium]|nr:hypothetical protein [Chloroflexota bacterium]
MAWSITVCTSGCCGPSGKPIANDRSRGPTAQASTPHGTQRRQFCQQTVIFKLDDKPVVSRSPTDGGPGLHGYKPYPDARDNPISLCPVVVIFDRLD